MYKSIYNNILYNVQVNLYQLYEITLKTFWQSGLYTKWAVPEANPEANHRITIFDYI